MIDIKAINIELRQFNGSNAKIWAFNPTLGRLVIRLWRFDKIANRFTQESFISVLACEHIKGPFLWTNAEVVVNKYLNKLTQVIEYKILEINAGFEIIAIGGVGIQRQPL